MDDDYKNKLGKSEATLQAEKDRLSAALQAQKDLIPDVLEEGKEAENMALLASINAELNTIGADITDLLNEAEEVAKKVKANNGSQRPMQTKVVPKVSKTNLTVTERPCLRVYWP